MTIDTDGYRGQLEEARHWYDRTAAHVAYAEIGPGDPFSLSALQIRSFTEPRGPYSNPFVGGRPRISLSSSLARSMRSFICL